MPLSQIVSASIEDGAVAPVDLSSVAQYTGFKNRLINGGFGIWQRGTSGFATGTYTADRWAVLNITSASQNADTPSSAFPFSIEFANTAASFPIVLQRIESINSQDLAGQQVSISFWAKNVTGSAILACEMYYPNSKDNYSSVTLIQQFLASASPSSSWTYYTFTSNALPSQVTNGLEVRIYRNNASAATTRVTGVQLEKGVTATSFDYRPYGTELQLCQRYYQNIGGNFSGVTEGATAFSISVPLYFNTRAIPTFATRTGYYFNARYAGGDVSIISPTLANVTANINGVWLQVVTSGRTANFTVVGRQQNTNGLNEFLSADAEL